MYLATVTNQIKCYDWPLGHLEKSYSSKEDSVLPLKSASWANNNDWMCIVTATGVVEILSFKESSGKLLHEIEGITNANYATFQNLNKRDITIAQGEKILIYDLKKCYIKKELGPTTTKSDFWKLKFDPTDVYLCAAARDNRICVFNSIGTYTTFHANHIGSLTNFAVCNQSGLKVAAGTENGTCILWEPDGSTNVICDTSKTPITDLVFDESNCLFYITESGKCVIRDSRNSETVLDFDLHFRPTCMDFCKDGIGFAICSYDGTINAFDVRNLGRPINKIPPEDVCDAKILQVSFSRFGDSSNNVIKYDTLSSTLSNFSHAGRSNDDIVQIVHGCAGLLDTKSEESIESSLEKVAYDVVQYDMKMPENQVGSSKKICSGNVDMRKQEILNMVRAAVQEEMEKVKQDLRTHVQIAIYDSTKKNFFELKMSLVKEFIKIEQILDGLKPKTGITELANHVDEK